MLFKRDLCPRGEGFQGYCWGHAFNLSSFWRASQVDLEIRFPESWRLSSVPFLSHCRTHFCFVNASLKQMCLESISDICWKI